MTYNDLATALSTYLQIQPTEPNFVAMLPRMIEQAEMRCYREVDFVATRGYSQVAVAAGQTYWDATYHTSFPAVAPGPPGSITPAPFPAYLPNLQGQYLSFQDPNNWVVLRSVSVTLGNVRTVLQRREETFMDEFAPNRAATGSPRYYAMLSTGEVLFAPAFANISKVEFAFTFRPTPISRSNASTWLSVNAPDMLLYAALVAGCGYVKNFGAQADDPRAALSWEGQYQTAKASAMAEEGRRKGEAVFDVVSPPPATTQTHGA